jgi:tetratricopeptide (TPR) repeat protein
MNGPRNSAHKRVGRRLFLLVGAAVAFTPLTSTADSWYEHYARAEVALEDQQWAQAIDEINSAIGKKGDSGARVRSYGMNVIPYFPYLKLGIAYYHLGQHDAALQAFETEARLGAIAQSESASAELERYRLLVEDARAAAAAEQQQQIRQIVEQSIDDARTLEAQGLWNEATAALDRALAVAPDDVDAQEAMRRLRARIAEVEQDRERDQRAARLVEAGKTLVDEGNFGQASSLFRQAQYLKPSPAVRELLADAQGKLLTELEGSRAFDDWRSAIAAWLLEAERLESAGEIAAALDRLQSVLVLEPSHPEAVAIQSRLLEARKEAETDRARQTSIDALLAHARSELDAGAIEEALAAANRVLALDPGNAVALQYIAQAYGVINRQLLGTAARGNIPPAVRFVDLRSEGEDGLLVETIGIADFLLRGVIIDDSPVDVVVYGNDDRVLEADLGSQPLGEFFITEFSVASRLSPGRTTFSLVATDSENLTSGSEYMVLYARPFYRAPWFSALVLAVIASAGGAIMWRRSRRREELRKRRFNPYVAGAPVLEDGMFFGRRELVDRILQTIHNNSLLIYGERRIGKTSIQHQLKKRLSELDDPIYDFHPVYVDLQGTPESDFFRTIADDIFEQLEPVLGGLRPVRALSDDYSYRDFVSDVREVLKVLDTHSARRVRLVLLIDEVDELNDYDPRVNQKLRSLFMKNFAENLVAVVSGVEIKKQWEREGSPWYNFFEEIEVRPLEPDDARELIEHPIGGMFKVESGVSERIISLTAGKPYLIQKMCIALVTRLHAQQRRKITMADVDAIAGTNQA